MTSKNNLKQMSSYLSRTRKSLILRFQPLRCNWQARTLIKPNCRESKLRTFKKLLSRLEIGSSLKRTRFCFSSNAKSVRLKKLVQILIGNCRKSVPLFRSRRLSATHLNNCSSKRKRTTISFFWSSKIALVRRISTANVASSWKEIAKNFRNS